MAVTLDKPTEDGLAYVSFPISKMERTDDGDLLVFGKATDGSVDSDEQIVDTAWSRKAMQDWFDTGANVRMSHDPRRPVGKGIQIELSGDGHWLKSLVVDREAQRLVEKGVLTAYSVGISRPVIDRDITGKARGGIIKGGSLAEISLVDRPANRSCGFQLVKSAAGGEAEWVGKMFGVPSPADAVKIMGKPGPRTYSDPIAQRLADALAAETSDMALKAAGAVAPVAEKKVLASGRVVDSGGQDRSDVAGGDFAGPGKTFPIESQGDVSDAASLAHHAKNPGKVRARIASIARRKFPGMKLPPSLAGKKGTGPDDPSGPDEGIDFVSVSKAVEAGELSAEKAERFLLWKSAGTPDAMDAQVMAHLEDARDMVAEALRDQAMDMDDEGGMPEGAEEYLKPKAGEPDLVKGGTGEGGDDDEDATSPDDAADDGMAGDAVGTRSKAKKPAKGKNPFGGKKAIPFGKKPGDDDEDDDAGKAADPDAIKAEIARLEAMLAKCVPTVGVAHVPQASPVPAARGGGSVDSVTSAVVADEPDWMRLGKAMDRTTSAPYAAQRAHDATCAAYDPALVKAAYPALTHAGDAVDPGELKELAMSAMAAGKLGEAESWLSAAKAAEFLTTADPLAVGDAHAGLFKSFTDMYPSVRLSPGQIMPQQFRRPYISEGHAASPAPSGDVSPGTVPSYHPQASDFRRGPLTAGHEAPSPGNKGDNNPYPAGTPAGAVYAHAVLAQQASAAMRTIHDTYAARWNGVCPMSMNAGPVSSAPAGPAVKGKKKKGKKALNSTAVPGAMDPVPPMPATPAAIKAHGAALPDDAAVVTGVDISAMLTRWEKKLRKLSDSSDQRESELTTLIKSQSDEIEKLRRDIDILGSQPAEGGPNRSAITKSAAVIPAERRSLVDEAGERLRAEQLTFLQSFANSGDPALREQANHQIAKMLTN